MTLRYAVLPGLKKHTRKKRKTFKLTKWSKTNNAYLHGSIINNDGPALFFSCMRRRENRTLRSTLT